MNMAMKSCVLLALAILGLSPMAGAQTQAAAQPTGTIHLADIRMRDVCIMPDGVQRPIIWSGPGAGACGSIRAPTL